MNGIILYRWILGSQTDFLNQFTGNPTLYQMAVQFWSNLGNYAPIGFLLGIFISALMVYGYYKPFNEMPGRHYLPKYWFAFFGINALMVFGVTYLSEIYMIKTTLDNVTSYEIKLALANTLYSILWFVLGSMICCKSIQTNAYKMF